MKRIDKLAKESALSEVKPGLLNYNIHHELGFKEGFKAARKMAMNLYGDLSTKGYLVDLAMLGEEEVE